MVRRQALVDARGFESGLRAAGAEGCEDYLLACRVAERFHFAVAPEHLVGYRDLPQNMSSNRPRMLRSWMLVFDEMLNRHPDRKDVLNDGLREYSGWLARDAVSAARYRQLPQLLLPLFRARPRIAARLLNDVLSLLTRQIVGRLLRTLRLKTPRETPQRGGRFVVGVVDEPAKATTGNCYRIGTRETYVD